MSMPVLSFEVFGGQMMYIHILLASVCSQLSASPDFLLFTACPWCDSWHTAKSQERNFCCLLLELKIEKSMFLSP